MFSKLDIANQGESLIAGILRYSHSGYITSIGDELSEISDLSSYFFG